MLSFFSGNVRDVNSDRAVAQCLEKAFPSGIPNTNLVILVHVTIGHKLGDIYTAIHNRLPNALVFGCTGMAVVGKGSVGESLNEVALMAIADPDHELAFATIEDITTENSAEKGTALFAALKEKAPNLNAAYLITPGLDIDFSGFISNAGQTLGSDVRLFGGGASDNGKSQFSYQLCNATVHEHAAFALSFSDPTLKVLTRATHGFTPYGAPLTVTKAEGNTILEFDGMPAFAAYTSHIDGDPSSDMNAALSFGAIGEQLDPQLAKEYGNTHILRLAYSPDGQTLHYPTTVTEGMQIWYTARDEARIFENMEQTLTRMKKDLKGGTPVAVLQTDCLARGRMLFDRVSKDEITEMIQSTFHHAGEQIPWLGNYGLAEFARLGDKDVMHNYTTSLMVFYRQ